MAVYARQVTCLCDHLEAGERTQQAVNHVREQGQVDNKLGKGGQKVWSGNGHRLLRLGLKKKSFFSQSNIITQCKTQKVNLTYY